MGGVSVVLGRITSRPPRQLEVGGGAEPALGAGEELPLQHAGIISDSGQAGVARGAAAGALPDVHPLTAVTMVAKRGYCYQCDKKIKPKHKAVTYNGELCFISCEPCARRAMGDVRFEDLPQAG